MTHNGNNLLSHEYLDKILNSMADMLIVTDPHAIIQTVNTSLLSHLGYAEQELIGKPVGMLFAEEEEEEEEEEELYPFRGSGLKDLLQKGALYNVEKTCIKKDGSSIFVSLSGSAMRDSNGSLQAVVSLAQDITERKLIQQRLQQAEKMEAIGQLAAGIAHDFNNQLTGILGYAEMLSRELLHNESLRHDADSIILSVKRSSDLTRQLLAFARKGKFLAQPVDINDIVHEVSSFLTHTVEKRISIVQNLRASPPFTMGDPSQLQNALLNIAINSRDAISSTGSITFSTQILDLDQAYCSKLPYDFPPGRYLQISIADTGSGMSKETMKHIFEPFFTTKEKGKGTGMGLAAAYGIVKNHKGAIEVSSKPGQGTTFNLYLPLTDQVSVTEDRSQPAAPGRLRAHILLVDDEEVILDAATQMLQSLGHHVTPCINGSQALAHYKQSWRDIDLVFLDLVMPHMGGSATFAAIRAINPQAKVILASGYTVEGEAQQLLDQGAHSFIQKPYRLADLSRMISNVISPSPNSGDK
jgi:PAS domain S-box-containing protein